jgi:enoyl-[acyl-carrier protein] reductase I
MLSLAGRSAAVFGVANKRSIAWAIAQKLYAAGARISIGYQHEGVRQDVESLLLEMPGAESFQCDVSNDREIEAAFNELGSRLGRLDILVHSIAFAPAQELNNRFLMTSREGFRIAHDVSVYSLVALCRAAAPLMTNGGAVTTLTYYGSQKVVPFYNVMGVAKAALEASVRYLSADLGDRNIRVNAVSAGPIKTLAARGIGGLSDMISTHKERAPLRRNTLQSEVADAALFLSSDLSAGITGDILYVDAGFNIMSS